MPAAQLYANMQEEGGTFFKKTHVSWTIYEINNQLPKYFTYLYGISCMCDNIKNYIHFSIIVGPPTDRGET